MTIHRACRHGRIRGTCPDCTPRSGARRPELNTYRWQKLRAAVRRRDGNRCVNCGDTQKLSVHHIIKPRHGGTDDMSNLVALCLNLSRSFGVRIF
jgi:predicted restriction endonuclease